MRQEEEYSELKEIRTGCSPGKYLGLDFLLLYTYDIQELEHTMLAMFADGTASWKLQ